ncbi:MAG: GNAT family N-acetyltransferase [Sandaracinus sp.]|nr:GNAT family N-acetyltransferase [Sandaracinus sp.]MCB9636681.1 GNAT family N-acetyltransferase [Sandaracinus sp.]
MDDLLRPIRASDDEAVAAIIRDVMTEHGASGPGFAIHDAEVAAMSECYAARERSACFVIESFDEGVLGCAAVAPLEGAAPEICELRKMYFRPALRGRGAGRRMLRHVLRVAASLGFARCYLETLASMKKARALYESEGFEKLSGPLGHTGHFACDTQYVRRLDGRIPDLPTIVTERLVLRGPAPCDVDAFHTWLGDAEAMRFVGDGKPRSKVEVAHFLAASLHAFEARGVGFWAVTLAAKEATSRALAPGHVVGDVGIWPILRSGHRGFRGPELELGYRFAVAHHGRGYATEAARAVVTHAQTLGLQGLVAVTHPDNAASQGVLRKCGFADEGITDRYYDMACRSFARAV